MNYEDVQNFGRWQYIASENRFVDTNISYNKRISRFEFLFTLIGLPLFLFGLLLLLNSI